MTESVEKKQSSIGDRSDAKPAELEGFEDSSESFEDLLDSYNEKMSEDLQVGDMIEGEIISIGQDSVYFDTKSKSDGVLDKAELIDENGDFPYKIGDVLELYIVSFNESEIILSKAISGIQASNLLRDAYENKIPVEGKVSATCKGGFNIDITGKKAFCPVSQIDTRYVEDLEEYVGTTHRFIITRYEDNGRNIVVNRRQLLEKELKLARETYMAQIEVGAVYEGTVTNIMEYGAFIEIFPGIEGMVHISEISWSRVENVSEVLKKEQPVTVKVISLKPAEKDKPPKIGLSMKQAAGDPWDHIDDKFSIGDKVTGVVTRCASFGAFVEIAPGLEGLVHISEMSYTKRILKPEDVVTPGETVSVVIQSIDPERKRISLSIKVVEGDPWLDAKAKFSVGKAVDGVVERKEKFGYFITLTPGITGLLPQSKISKAFNSAAIDKLKTGDSIRVKIESVDVSDRKISLGVTDESDGSNWQKYAKDSNNTIGVLGEKLMQAMKDDKTK